MLRNVSISPDGPVLRSLIRYVDMCKQLARVDVDGSRALRQHPISTSTSQPPSDIGEQPTPNVHAVESKAQLHTMARLNASASKQRLLLTAFETRVKHDTNPARPRQRSHSSVKRDPPNQSITPQTSQSHDDPDNVSPASSRGPLLSPFMKETPLREHLNLGVGRPHIRRSPW